MRTKTASDTNARTRIAQTLASSEEPKFRYETFDNYAAFYGETGQHWGDKTDFREANWTAVGHVVSKIPLSRLMIHDNDKPIWPHGGFLTEGRASAVFEHVAAQANKLVDALTPSFVAATGCRQVPFRPPGQGGPTKDAPLTFVPQELLDLNLAAQLPTLRVPQPYCLMYVGIPTGRGAQHHFKLNGTVPPSQPYSPLHQQTKNV